MDDFIEDLGESKPPVPQQEVSTSSFITLGESSEHDPKGILDENLKLRQTFARMLASKGEQLIVDKDMMGMFIKLTADNDKSVISQARLKVDEKGNAATSDLVAAIVREAISHGDQQRMEYMQNRNNPNAEPVVIEHDRFADVELPPASRDIPEEEIVMGTTILSEKEIAKGAGVAEIEYGTNTSFDD